MERHVLIGPDHPGLPTEYGLVSTNGPSLVRTGEGRYHLYFAHHAGETIRLATADRVTGPYTLHPGGVLHRDDTPAAGPYPHIASPDVHVLGDGTLRMYFHAPVAEADGAHLPWWGRGDGGDQHTMIAHSTDGGFRFTVTHPRPFAPSYLRAVPWRDTWWALAMPGVVLCSPDGLTDWLPVTDIFRAPVRHSAVIPGAERWDIWCTRIGDDPERILHTKVFRADWEPDPFEDVIAPTLDWEGSDLPAAPSEPGIALGPQRQLRDPFVFDDVDGSRWLLYAFAGEQGIAATRLR